MSRKNFFLGMLAIAGSNALLAQTTPDTTARQLDELVVTATKSPKKLSETGKLVTVIPREVIDRSAGKDLSQVLNEQTGVLVSGANSNPGKDKTIYLRGASDKYTLILLDGIPLNDPSQVGGQYDIRLIPLNSIDRVEILKGSQSVLYGSNAVAGVINIITRKAMSDQTTGSGILSYGSYKTLKAGADFGRKGKIFEYDLNYQYLNTDGIAEAKDTSGAGNFPKNGYNMQAFQARTGINVTDNLKLSPFFRYSEFKGSISNGPFEGGKIPYTANLVNTGLTANLKYHNGSVYAYYGYDYTQRNYGDPYNSAYQGRFHHAEAFVTHHFSENVQLVGGVNFQTYTLVRPDTVNSIISPYASLFYKNKGLNVELGGRYNHDNKYGNNFTYSFNPSYLINRTLKLFVNISSGFRAPSVNELYGPFGANPALKPEKSNTSEGGAQLFLLGEKLSVTADYFDRVVKNMIVYAYDPVSGNTGYFNRDKQHDHGIEAEINYNLNNTFSFRASYTYVTGETTQKLDTKDTTIKGLQLRPKNNFQFTAGVRPFKGMFISSSLQVTGERFDYAYQSVPPYAKVAVNLGSYTLWNAYAEYQVPTTGCSVFLDVKNITNKTNYYEVYGYSVQGTNLTAGVHIKL
ncbi:MAG TPA: TonB-dependent receptor [Puia sp.]|nr:TonB-dependent receptor [Puia sp.]